MKKLLLVAALAIVAGQAQANVGSSCGEYVKCEGSVREGQTFKCPDCVCPRVTCPIPPKTICKAVAQPVQESYCEERVATCGTCHKVKASCGCKGGFNHRHHAHNVVVVKEEAAQAAPATRTPKRIKAQQ